MNVNKYDIENYQWQSKEIAILKILWDNMNASWGGTRPHEKESRKKIYKNQNEIVVIRLRTLS